MASPRSTPSAAHSQENPGYRHCPPFDYSRLPVNGHSKRTQQCDAAGIRLQLCSNAEVVPWCGQNPDCGHPECTEALATCAARHRLDDRRFHGQVNVAIIERQLWERYEEVIAEEAS
jgi:hypothetical protein